jgi:4-amino-4-deoxy-L-arabinose transferase-like glycosyltransferase
LTDEPIRRPISRNEWLMVVASSFAASALAALWSWRHNAMLNYGDAVAHLHIARRVLDSHRPGLSQLGSVWLPLPHILLVPFVAVYAWWANGIAGLIPSALAYIAGCAGVYRLARHWLRPSAAVVTLAFFALNPNLLYLQTTAMTEPLFLCEMVWLAVCLVEWRESLKLNPPHAPRLLYSIATILIAAVFTRYDGWILAVLAWTSVGIVQLRRDTLRRRSFWIASVAVVAAPLLWFSYNAIVFGDWLDFARGPYSAAAIELRTATPGSGPPHPGWHDPWVSLLFFMKCA